jgi:hypothetical protein
MGWYPQRVDGRVTEEVPDPLFFEGHEGLVQWRDLGTRGGSCEHSLPCRRDKGNKNTCINKELSKQNRLHLRKNIQYSAYYNEFVSNLQSLSLVTCQGLVRRGVCPR